jgi:hypothetical protein
LVSTANVAPMGIWNWLSYNAGVVEAIATAVAAVVAVIGIAVAVADAKNRNAPVVIPLFRRAPDNYFAIDFVVRNFGQTPVRKVKLFFNPTISADESDETMGHLTIDAMRRKSPSSRRVRSSSTSGSTRKSSATELRGTGRPSTTRRR